MYTFIGTILAGTVLEVARSRGQLRMGFAAIFAAAALARLAAARALARHQDPPYRSAPENYFSFFSFLRQAPRSNFARFVFFIASVQFGTWIAAPYFSLYMLRDLHFSYMEYMIVSASLVVSQFYAMHLWGRLSDALGSKFILNICGYAVAVVPLLWLLATSVWQIVLIQIFAGIAWSGLNLAAQNFLFDSVSPPKRARCAAYQAIISGFLILFGSLLGALLLGSLPSSISLFGFHWQPLSPILFIFCLSGLVRLAAAPLLLPLFHEVRTTSRSIKQPQLTAAMEN